MKKSIKKTNLLVALLATTLFSTVATAAVPKTTLIKAETVNETLLTDTAHINLKLSLSQIKVTYPQLISNSELDKQKQIANQNKPLTLTKTNVIAE